MESEVTARRRHAALAIGEADGPPNTVDVAWIDVLTGMMTVAGVLAALNERRDSGLGQYIDLGLFDVGLMAMVNQIQR